MLGVCAPELAGSVRSVEKSECSTRTTRWFDAFGRRCGDQPPERGAQPAERFLRYSRGLKRLVGDPIVGPNGERFHENAIDIVARDFSDFVTALSKPPSA